MARRMCRKTLVADCHVALVEVGNAEGDPGYLPDPLRDPLPDVRAGKSGLLVVTRCPDAGNVELEVWAGDPGLPPPGWDVVFQGQLETKARGFDASDGSGSVFHVNARPGIYRVRAEARRDRRRRIDAVRFIFAGSDDLEEP